MWICAKCTFENSDKNDKGEDLTQCVICSETKTVLHKSTWKCAICTFDNAADNTGKCQMCGQAMQVAPPSGNNTSNKGGNNNNSSSSKSPAKQPERKQDSHLRSKPFFVKSVEEAAGVSNVHPKFMEGIENLVSKSWQMLHETKLEGDYLESAEKAIVKVAVQKAIKAQGVWLDMVSMCTAEDRALVQQKCGECNKSGSDVSLLLCGEQHAYCVPCTRTHITKWTEKVLGEKANIPLTCPKPECKDELDAKTIRRCLTAKQHDQYLEATTQAYFAQTGSGIVTCPDDKCKSVMEYVKPTGIKVPKEMTIMDDHNNPLTANAYKHYAEYRLRCRNCQGNFCAGCKAMPYHLGFNCIEAKEYKQSKICRYCPTPLTAKNTEKNSQFPVLEGVCTAPECAAKKKFMCTKLLECGHPCAGVRDESKHPPCLDEKCAAKAGVNSNNDEFCNICWVESLGQAPVVQLDCGHIFHRQCASSKVEKKWPGVRITFGFLDCPICKGEMKHGVLDTQKKPLLELREQLKSKGVARLKIEGMLNDEKLVNSSSRYYKKPEQYALDSFAYYNCFKCGKYYFGGKRDCEQNAAADDRPLEEFICYDCSPMKNVHCKIPDHQEYHLWKCRFCCNPAVWFCFGTTHFCEPCHKDNPMEKTRRARSGFQQCKGRLLCPLKVEHSPNGNETECEFSLGCGLCSEQKNKLEEARKREEKVDAVASGKEQASSSPDKPKPVDPPAKGKGKKGR